MPAGMRAAFILSLLPAVLLSACARVPFDPVEFNSVEGLDPEKVRGDFQAGLADQFEVVESVVLTYRGREFSALGYSMINEKEESLAVAGFTPMGVKLFELAAVGGAVEHSFSFPQMKPGMDPEQMAEAMAADIRRVYFDRLPDAGAEVHRSKDRIYYRQPSGQGTLEYIFGGPEAALVRKRYSEGGRAVWSVRYFEYQSKGSKIYPSKIFFENHRQEYEIVLRLKEIVA